MSVELTEDQRTAVLHGEAVHLRLPGIDKPLVLLTEDAFAEIAEEERFRRALSDVAAEDLAKAIKELDQ